MALGLRGAGLRLTVKPTVYGLEYLAELPGPFLFVANHPSALDAPLIQQALALSKVLKTAPAHRAHALRTVAVSAEPPTGLTAVTEKLLGLRSARRLGVLLSRGVSVILFPERHRADDGTLTAFDLGAARLGIRSGVTIVPVTLVGSYRALPPWRALPEPGRPNVTVIFGRPIVAAAGSEPTAVTEEITQAITLGLAEDSRGWYGALRADADTAPAGSGDDERTPARWRRVWRATEPAKPGRRAVWVEK